MTKWSLYFFGRYESVVYLNELPDRADTKPQEPLKQEDPHLYDYIDVMRSNPSPATVEESGSAGMELTPCAAYGTNVALGAKKSVVKEEK